MRRYLEIGLLLSLFAGFSLAADDVASAVAGTVKSVDKDAKTAVVKTSEGTEHTFHFVGRSVDHGAKTVTVKTAQGGEETYHMADRAARESGKGLEKAGKVTVYYTEDAGKKIAHFFK
jgi:hypothetical protein